MNALYLKDPADKTRRRLRGQIETGKPSGGNACRYQVVHALGAVIWNQIRIGYANVRNKGT